MILSPALLEATHIIFLKKITIQLTLDKSKKYWSSGEVKGETSQIQSCGLMIKYICIL